MQTIQLWRNNANYDQGQQLLPQGKTHIMCFSLRVSAKRKSWRFSNSARNRRGRSNEAIYGDRNSNHLLTWRNVAGIRVDTVWSPTVENCTFSDKGFSRKKRLGSTAAAVDLVFAAITFFVSNWRLTLSTVNVISAVTLTFLFKLIWREQRPGCKRKRKKLRKMRHAK